MMLNTCHNTYEYFYIILYLFSFLFHLLRVRIEMTFAALCGTLKFQNKKKDELESVSIFVSCQCRTGFISARAKRDEFYCIKMKAKRNGKLKEISAWCFYHTICYLPGERVTRTSVCVSVNKISLFIYICEEKE